ncbi:hypothetical protein KR074_009817 [Drosophila pseudoananassae]|nr:hypothetical protein KR074_009817 [Drosophila pseudoananassae]
MESQLTRRSRRAAPSRSPVERRARMASSPAPRRTRAVTHVPVPEMMEVPQAPPAQGGSRLWRLCKDGLLLGLSAPVYFQGVNVLDNNWLAVGLAIQVLLTALNIICRSAKINIIKSLTSAILLGTFAYLEYKGVVARNRHGNCYLPLSYIAVFVVNILMVIGALKRPSR